MTESQQTPLDQAAQQYIYDLAALTPTVATQWGIAGYDDQLEDFSPEYHDAVAARTKQMLDDVEKLEGSDIDKAVMRDRLGIELELHARGENLRDLNNITSPVQSIRDSLAQMPPEHRPGRLAKVPAALAGYQRSLEAAAAEQKIAAARQIDQVLKQLEPMASGEFFAEMGAQADIDRAAQACGELATWLRNELLPKAPTADAFGRERYELFSHEFVGAKVDLDEAYQWGQERLAEIIDQQQQCATELYGAGVSVAEAIQRLDADERYTLHGVDALQAWMQEKADQAVADLAGVHFDIPEEMRTIEACIDPAGTGGIFYTAPTEDFSRPGRMWWSVPAGEDTFHTWQELTTVYHEGVPGHHLQLGMAIAQREHLNLWRRIGTWNSGHGEGWALYAEALMAELGYLDDPGFRMGLYDAQRLRAARVVLDIGVHLGKTTPEGGQWSFEYAKQFLRSHVAMSDANLDFELHRYFGWAGQAPSYALGQRLWQQMRAAANEKGMSAPDFHAKALAQGSIPMDILRAVVFDS
ncbi:DUF885 domain-containing protein [Corynebacterium sp. HS2168-gen11]|uniref:DUF885 domain-containing protein n=1 Tax=Corynebacterium sp. HS2168-gen11 TaxID=2974027 RepID=UPI00216AD1D5|nr:DUF885 domain-containing protein [Corynebacterium sp. HS2168-gen11]MCS4535782.1 DUF885 domain-containing protein [Corynebacterium sp. HS2168-gen11]